MGLRIGIDVGGTHTDAVVLDARNNFLHGVKTPTTREVGEGIATALERVIQTSSTAPEDVEAVMLGTTHCTNAVVERQGLARVGILRLGAPASQAIKPLRAFPDDLRRVLGNIWRIAPGGHEYDGREIAPIDTAAVREAGQRMKDEHVQSVAVASVFSPVSPTHEKEAAVLLREELGNNVPISVSHELGSIGLLERENATILNAALVQVAAAAIEGFREAMMRVGLAEARLYLTQNDGTLMSAEYALRYPVRTIASGPTNSIRGAAFLTGLRDGVIVDIGGTTTLVGALVNGFPRQSALAVEIGGVRTNFRMPDLIAVGCGGGTIVRVDGGTPRVGPDSLGYRLAQEGKAWGGSTLTTTDIALAAGYARIDDPRCDPARLQSLDANLVQATVMSILTIVEDAIDRIKTSAEPAPVVLVGGGGIIVPPERYNKLKGVAHVIRPPNYQYANAVGAAIGQVSGEIDRIFSLDHMARSDAVAHAKQLATEEAVKAGANANGVEIVEVDEIPIAYLPGNALRVRVKAVGPLAG